MSAFAEELPVARVTTPRGIGVVGIVLGLFAFWISLPPMQQRSIVWPLVVGAVGIACGAFAISREERRVGWGAVASCLLGIGGGILATRSSLGNLDTVFVWGALFAAMLRYATPITFAALAGMVSERSGVVNIGLEGMMLMGAFFAAWGADITNSWFLGLVIGTAFGGLAGLVFAFFAIHLRADQIVGGVAINFLALGITGYFFVQLYHNDYIHVGVSTIPDVNIPLIERSHFLGPAIGHLNLMIWAGIAVACLSYVVLFKTPIGLRIRACGEHPRAADTVGINVFAVRYGCVVLSGVLAALGGVYLSDGYGGGTFIANMTDGRGFIALAAMI
ncbi:MAG TPA: ABC transporter permease, partial [Gaiellaceae bacterium]